EGVQRPEYEQRQHRAGNGPAAARNPALEAVPATGQNVLEARRIAWAATAAAPAARNLPPGTAIIGIAATPARIVVPGHLAPFSRVSSLPDYIGKPYRSINVRFCRVERKSAR